MELYISKYTLRYAALGARIPYIGVIVCTLVIILLIGVAPEYLQVLRTEATISYILVLTGYIITFICCIAAVILLLNWYLFPYVIINEECSIWESFTRSSARIYGHRSDITQLLIWPSIIAAFARPIISAVSYGPTALFISYGERIDNMLLALAGAVLYVLFLIYMVCIIPLCAAQYYHSAKQST